MSDTTPDPNAPLDDPNTIVMVEDDRCGTRTVIGSPDPQPVAPISPAGPTGPITYTVYGRAGTPLPNPPIPGRTYMTQGVAQESGYVLKATSDDSTATPEAP